MRILVVSSTSGSLLNELLNFEELKENFVEIVCDRECGSINVGKSHNIKTTLINESDSLIFSSRIELIARESGIDFIFSFYLKLFKGSIIESYKNRIVNFHPSLLPAFAGFNAIKKAHEFGVKYLGTTIHFIDDSIDMGPIILQSILPIDPDDDLRTVTHRLFIQQCKGALQVLKWLLNQEIEVSDRMVIIKRHSTYTSNKALLSEFSPALDYDLAINYYK